MRVRLKGINRVSKRLADGRRVTYYYAWKGGPRLAGEPGSPEFHASFNEAVGSRIQRPENTMRSLIDRYLQSSAFLSLSPSSQKDYRRHLKKIEPEFGDLPLAALADRRIRSDFLEWRDRLAVTASRQAELAFVVLARVISWGYDRGLAPANPCQRPGKLHRSTRVQCVWSEEQEASFYEHAPAHFHLALLLALWTGQRQGDLLRLNWSAYNGTHIRLQQNKTGARVLVPVGQRLRHALDTEKLRQEAIAEVEGTFKPQTILVTSAGRPWTGDGFRGMWRKACDKAGISGVTFHDLRGTAVTRLALAGCSVAEIATITGHSLNDVGTILDKHYLKRDSRLAESAIKKLEDRDNLPTARPTAD